MKIGRNRHFPTMPGGRGGAWKLTDISSLVSLVDPQNISGSDGDLITSITDDIGITWSQTTANKKPLLKIGNNGINNQNAVRFDGTDDLLVTSNFNSATKGTVFAVVRLTTSLINNQTLLSSGDEASSTRYWFCRTYRNSSNPNIEIRQKNDDVVDEISGGSTIAVSTPYLLIWQSDGSSYTLRVNGNNEVLNSVAGSNNGEWLGSVDGRDNFAIGCLKFSTETQFFKGDLALLGIATDNFNVAQLESYCATRFGLDLLDAPQGGAFYYTSSIEA